MTLRCSNYSDKTTAYSILPFLTILVKKDTEEVIFKWGAKQRFCDYDLFKDTVRFLYAELECAKGREK